MVKLMYPNIQAYDRGVMFSPDGRLFQVDYAREAVRKGATSVGLVVDNGVVLVAHKNMLEPLSVPSTMQKIFRIDSYIGATYSGMIADGLHIVNMMRNKTQTHRMVYNETESVETTAREIAEEMQITTQYGGIRPYAVSLLIGGIDKAPRLFEIDPGASYLGFKADAIGSGKKVAEEMLIKSWKENMNIEDGINLGMSIIKKINEGKLSENNVDISTIKKDVGFEMFSADKVAKYI
jgi:proteasome alpha subunit